MSGWPGDDRRQTFNAQHDGESNLEDNAGRSGRIQARNLCLLCPDISRLDCGESEISDCVPTGRQGAPELMDPVQIDLFDDRASEQAVLNGMYYERATSKFVSYVCGRRHFEVAPGRCLGDKDWKEKTMKERAI